MKKQLIIAVLLSMFALSSYSQIFEKQGAGVTIIVHGWNPDDSQPAWMQIMADSIIARSGGLGHVANITVTGTQGNLTSTCSDWDFDLVNQDHAEIVLLINWTDVANHINTGVSVQEVAASVAPKLYIGQNGEPALSELPIHLIGHSRGAGMVFEIAGLLGIEGVEVEHLTALDPHPLTSADPQGLAPPMGPGETIDSTINVYDNILFADVYYQNIEYPKGEYVSGAYNRLWTSLPGGYHNETGYTYNILGTDYDFSDHLNTILAYYATIDLATPTSNGEATMTQSERDSWFNAYENEGENTGFQYSRQISGNRKSTDNPVIGGDAILDGLHNDALLGGNGTRQNLNWTSAVWPNILEISMSKNSEALSSGNHTLIDGDTLDIDLLYRSYANAGTITLFIDSDRNPYNNNDTQIGTLNTNATGSVITANSDNWTVAGLTEGEKYYIYGKIDDNTRQRFLYAPFEFEYQIPTIHDLSVTDILKPVKNFENSHFTVEITNNGNQNESDFPVSYTANSDTITETYTGTIAPGDSVQYSFNQTIDLSSENIYPVTAKTELASDDSTDNDEFSTHVNTYVNPNTMFFIYDDYIAVPNNPAINFTDDFTIETWFYAHSTKVQGKVISKHGNDGTTRSGYTIEYDGSNIRAVIGVGESWASVTAPVNTDQWYHVAMVYNSGSLELYLNGVLQTGTASGTLINNDLDLYIGASQAYGDYWTGYIEETRIWNDARTGSEILDNMNSEINPQSDNLLAYYDFNRGIPEGDNTAIGYLPDMTDNNFHGSMHNFALQAGLADGNFFEDCSLDLAKPVPDQESIETISDECSASVTDTPTATDNCTGTITGTTTDPLTYTAQGIHTITWTYDDGNGNVVTQTQDV
ncbi:MAG: LamG-like jellyroll fold domain-containing protein, partial [Bacteroidales bacterium]